MRIEEGRLTERRCPHCGNLDRRAFGESESPRGELASYAIGWTSGHETVMGHMTVGIGVGNEGGGSFHIQIHVDDEGEIGMSLVDEPFEDVPQGGPDLSREEALAHGDLRYVWWVADEVMLQDRRAWWMTHWLLRTAAYATPPVVEGTEPVRHVVHDSEGDWQLMCGTVESEPQPFHLFHALDRDQSLLAVLDLDPGWRADRRRFGRGWKRSQLEI